MRDWTPGQCPLVELVSNGVWCANNPFCPSNALVWTASSGDLLFMAAMDALTVRTMSIWNSTTTQWLETLVTYPSSETSCSGAQLPFPSSSIPHSPCHPIKEPVSPTMEPEPISEEPQTLEPSSPESVPSTDPYSPLPTPTSEPILPIALEPTPTATTPEVVPDEAKAPSFVPSLEPFSASPSHPVTTASPRLSSPSTIPSSPHGPASPSSFNVPGSTPSASPSSRVGLIVGLSIGIPLLVGALATAGALIWLHTGASGPIAGAALNDAHDNPLYVSQSNEAFNPLYRAPTD